ncbi:DUF1385 domain-containing protein [Candidatus Woesearchaeota archaeon]|nr:DUF1385 domain-containing protein [Candidatus Woesearchaeota archaeon]
MAGKCNVGGQAVIEGVLMKNEEKIAIAVRRPDRKISIKKETMTPVSKKIKFLGWPFFRGIVNLIEMLVVGIRALNYSANESLGEKEEKISKTEFAITTIIAIAVAVGIFILLPLYLTKITQTQGILFNLIDGVIRVVIFILYILAISLMKDVRRLFEYHGAEHKTVNCYEDGKSITAANVKKYTTVHRRCGTTFLLIVLIISIIIFSLIVTDSFWIKFGGRIVLLPVIAGIGYELLKLGAKFPNSFLLNILVWPGLALQKMTTREPDKKQIEVAIAAFKAVVKCR